MLKRILLWVAIAVTVASVGVLPRAAVAASAETVPVDYVHCTGEGTAAVSPPIQPPPAVGETGSYAFAGPGICTAAGDPDDVGTTGLTTISSAGTYDGHVNGEATPCGTGTASGTVSVTIAGETYTIKYTITFAAGQGTFVVTGGYDSDGSTSASGGGVVSITPIPATGCTTTAATGFTVVYHVHVVFQSD
jgi:hypothetical protein